MNKLTLIILILVIWPGLILLGSDYENNKLPGRLIYNSSDTTLTINSINNTYLLNAKKTKGKIKLDGIIDEPDWAEAQKAKDFYMVLPQDTSNSVARSEVMIAYDDKALYLAVILHDTIPGKRTVESLRRDFTFFNNDNFLFFLDTYNDQTTGYSFGVNSAGAKWDGIMSNGGDITDLMWECKWESKTKNYDDKWVAEMRIPFRSIRYKTGVNHWNIQFSRLDLKLNELSSWAPIPRQFPPSSLAYTGVLKWDTPPPESGVRLSLIPYILGGASRDYENNESIKYKRDIGFDAKVGISTSLNLDLTVNPDFSQAEVDDQIMDLDRFELYYPEKRQFFLENSDLFANYGSQDIRPFFSRRIGLDAPVVAGARLSGKLDNDWRLGVMDMQTKETGNLFARNYFVSTLQKKVFSRSNIGAIFVNKQYMNLPDNYQGRNYNRVAGLEYNLASKNNFWKGKFFGQRSFTPRVDSGSRFAQGATIDFERKRFHLSLNQYYVGNNYMAEVGYVRRRNFFQINPTGLLKFYPKSGNIEYHGFKLELDNYYLPGNSTIIDRENGITYNYSQTLTLTDREIGLDYFFRFKDRSHLELETNLWHVLLRSKFDPLKMGDYFLPAGSSYNWSDARLIYYSDNRKQFNYQLMYRYGGYFNGKRWYIDGNLNYRYQPFGYISMAFRYEKLLFPSPWEDTSFFLIGPKVDITLSHKLFFTTYVQYNEQIDNININSRLQWRYKPVSDFYIVYTDNYFPGSLNVKNRALVAKLSYWFN